MKNNKKSVAELEALLLDATDGIGDSYLVESLELHEKITDAPKRAKSPSIFFKKIAPIAACLLIVAALAPLSFILSMTLGGGCGSGDLDFGGDAPSMEDVMDGSDWVQGVVSLGETWIGPFGEITYLSLEDERVTLLVDLDDGASLLYSLVETRGDLYYTSNFATTDSDGRIFIDGGVLVSEEEDASGMSRITLDLSPFTTATGTNLSQLKLHIQSLGEIDLAPEDC